jgi:molybdopterin-containing oxidoreductase family iron-sulfur binding subunit
LNSIGNTIEYTDSIEIQAVNHNSSLKDLVQDINDGNVEVLIVIGSNPVYTAPVDLNFKEEFEKVPLRVHLGVYRDETAELCHWHIPQTHTLESWGDARSYDGTVTMVQPLIAPLYEGKSEHELLAVLEGLPGKKGYDVVREYWQNTGMRANNGTGPFESFWQQTIHDGFVPGSALPARNLRLNTASIMDASSATAGSDMEIIFAPDPTVWDGRFSNSGWLQELPKPLSKLTWDNAVLISPATAQGMDLHNTDVVDLTYQSRTLQAPVWILPGHPENSLTIHLGYGRERAGRVGNGTGFNAYTLRTSETPNFGTGVQVQKTGNQFPIYSTQDHHVMDLTGLGSMQRNRELLRIATVEEYENDHDIIHEKWHEPDPELTLYPDDHQYGGPNAWGMVIDLNKCSGCNTCTIACQSENNISVVGKDEVANGREMHWIRIDRYYSGDLDNPEAYHQPVTCMQCENAPCELVCPVGATVHSKEGLNDMVYNRCVGTRYCSNNCPYKVRRFNFYLYADFETPSVQLGRNPDVTVRSRGVMEKCTYCVQRINHARIDSKKSDTAIQDGDILTACQQACPTQAITFGNIKDRSSQVSKLKASALNYGLLTDLNTKPRTTYLARIRNPNPALQG